MPQRMARQRICREQDDVDEHHEGSDAHSELSVPPECVVDVLPQKRDEDDGEIERVAVEILKDERKFRLATVGALRFPNGTRGRICEKSAIIRFAVVVTGGAKTQRAA